MQRVEGLSLQANSSDMQGNHAESSHIGRVGRKPIGRSKVKSDKIAAFYDSHGGAFDPLG